MKKFAFIWNRTLPEQWYVSLYPVREGFPLREGYVQSGQPIYWVRGSTINSWNNSHLLPSKPISFNTDFWNVEEYDTEEELVSTHLADML